MTRRVFIGALLASAILAAGPVTDMARADEKRKGRSERDHDDAWGAREGGSILPLPEVLAFIGPQIDGEIILPTPMLRNPATIGLAREDGNAGYQNWLTNWKGAQAV